MFKRLLFASALFSSAAFAQQVDISGKDFLSGAGDARLAEIARQAAAAGKKLVVTAPAYWQGKVAGKLHAGAANANVQMSEGFFENVLVRVEDNKPAPPKPAEAAPKVETPPPAAKPEPKPKAEPKAEPKVQPKPAHKPVPDEITAVPAAPIPASAPAAALTPPPAAAPEPPKPVAPPPVVAPVQTAPAPVAPPKPVEQPAPAKPTVDPTPAIRQRMEKTLNDGRPADGSLTVSQLQKDDVLIVDGTVRAVLRRSGARTPMYWLEGELNLERAELSPTGSDRYRVNQAILNVANPALRSRAGGHFVGNVPAPESAERTSLQQQYADGHAISESLHPTDLHAGDIVYTGKTAAVVVRRSGTTLLRFWLDGDLNLGQAGLSKQGVNAYRVLSDMVR